MLLTSSDLGSHSLCKGSVLGQLLPEALTHVVINVIGTQQLLKGLKEEWYCKHILCFFSKPKNLKTRSFSQMSLVCVLCE